jgi:hypothetical protein
MKVSVLLVLVLAELKAAVTPVGTPETARATLLLKPLCPVTLIVLLAPDPPIGRLRVLAEDEMVKV